MAPQQDGTSLKRRSGDGFKTEKQQGPKRRRLQNEIEIANKKSSEEFVQQYLQSSESWDTWTNPKTDEKYSLRLISATDLSTKELNTCFHLVEETSGEDYRASSTGWHPAAKKKEMRSPDLRYTLVERSAEDGSLAICGFTSMMPTFEDGKPVVYCYEIHLKGDLQGTGLGRRLMQQIITVADNIPSVEKTMLTCFRCNEHALRFYERLGFSKDPFSPEERPLRGGKSVVPDYVILSRRTRTGGSDGRPGEKGEGKA